MHRGRVTWHEGRHTARGAILLPNSRTLQFLPADLVKSLTLMECMLTDEIVQANTGSHIATCALLELSYAQGYFDKEKKPALERAAIGFLH